MEDKNINPNSNVEEQEKETSTSEKNSEKETSTSEKNSETEPLSKTAKDWAELKATQKEKISQKDNEIARLMQEIESLKNNNQDKGNQLKVPEEFAEIMQQQNQKMEEMYKAFNSRLEDQNLLIKAKEINEMKMKQGPVLEKFGISFDKAQQLIDQNPEFGNDFEKLLGHYLISQGTEKISKMLAEGFTPNVEGGGIIDEAAKEAALKAAQSKANEKKIKAAVANIVAKDSSLTLKEKEK